MRQKVIIDTDPGIDDTMAIMLALKSPELELVGLTAIYGNVSCDQSSINALKLLEIAGRRDIPVAKGSNVPLFIEPHRYATHVHGEDGLGNSNLPVPKGKVLDISAAEFIVKMVLKNPGEITLVSIGPLTNIALAARIEPGIIKLVKEVVIMGGAATVRGNVTPVAEANIWQDPHAASIVFSAGWPLTMLGLDVTTKIIQTEEYLNEIYLANNTATNLIKAVMPFYQNFYFKRFGSKNIHTHDPSTIAYLLNSKLFTVKPIPVFVETEGRCAGQTVPDFCNQWGTQTHANICVEVNFQGVLDLIKKRLMN
ncbi:MAG TPA: nucleoside hydrolase [Lentisphaeria bacterium]|nr:MAG: hypothetical protein A2X47_05965 [Lentisphaerae bacterium GWF2_38_69]HBM14923.1 nucleoside hydrolase [Lentisphaeria bacterium]